MRRSFHSEADGAATTIEDVDVSRSHIAIELEDEFYYAIQMNAFTIGEDSEEEKTLRALVMEMGMGMGFDVLI